MLNRSRELRKRLAEEYHGLARGGLEFDREDFGTFATHSLIATYAAPILQIQAAITACATACRMGAILSEGMAALPPVEAEMVRRLYFINWQLLMAFQKHGAE